MRIVIATFGSLGDIHPKIALGLELRRRGHEVVFAVMDFYREKLGVLGFEWMPLRPHLDPEDRELTVAMMDAQKGTERILRGLILPNLDAMYEDLTAAVRGADLLITGEIIYPAKSVVEKTGISWISTSLAPISFFSAHDPNVYPLARWYRHLRFLPVAFHRTLFSLMTRVTSDWLIPYREFRSRLGLDPEHDPIFFGKNSDLLHLALFSGVLAAPQPDWHRPTLQAGFCFYDGQADSGKMPAGLDEFLRGGDPPVVFTLGSAAVMDARDFFEESARAAKMLGRRAVLLYGVFNEIPKTNETGEWRIETGDGIRSRIAAFDYAPYSEVFPRAACVVHQGGVGTTSQVLRAGVPQLVMPYSHDQPDNATRCVRLGVAETIDRGRYTAARAAKLIGKILRDGTYAANAARAAEAVRSENGTEKACDAVEAVLRSAGQRLES